MQTNNSKPELSATLSVDPRGHLRFNQLYAGPIVGAEFIDIDGKRHIYAGFTSTSEVPNEH